MKKHLFEQTIRLNTVVVGRPQAPKLARTPSKATSVNCSLLLSPTRSLSNDGFSTFQIRHSHVNAASAPSSFEPSSAVVYESFWNQAEADAVINDVTERMKRRRYEKGHWDAVITTYKEVELLNEESTLSEVSRNALQRTREHLGRAHCEQLRSSSWLPCHAIDLAKDGELKAHVDSVRFSGGLVAGVSLLSSSIMRLKPEKDGDNHSMKDGQDDAEFVDLYLPPLSLYVLTGPSRYEYTHELLPSGSAFVDPSSGATTLVSREKRLSIIFRDEKGS